MFVLNQSTYIQKTDIFCGVAKSKFGATVSETNRTEEWSNRGKTIFHYKVNTPALSFLPLITLTSHIFNTPDFP